MKRNLVLKILLVAAIGAAGEGEPDPARVALLAIADARRFDAGLVTTLAAAADPRTRGETARVLGRLDCLEALDTLEVLSRDRDPEVRAKAVEAVGRLALRWPGSLPVVQARRAGVVLVRAMADPSPEVRGRPGPLQWCRSRSGDSAGQACRLGPDLGSGGRRSAAVAATGYAVGHDGREGRAARTFACDWRLRGHSPGRRREADPVLVERATDKDPACGAFDAVRRGHAAALGAGFGSDSGCRWMVQAAWAALAAALEKSLAERSRRGRWTSRRCDRAARPRAPTSGGGDPAAGRQRLSAAARSGGGRRKGLDYRGGCSPGPATQRLEATVRIAT